MAHVIYSRQDTISALATIEEASWSVSHQMKNIGVLTSGADAQGMNAAVRSVVRMGLNFGARVFLIMEGYQGLIDGGSQFEEAHWNKVSKIIQLGGTIIGSNICKQFLEREGRLKAAKNLIDKEIVNLIVIGGGGSLIGANLFKEEWSDLLNELAEKEQITKTQHTTFAHLHIAGIVASIDNDFCGTDMTIGADSALHRILESVDAIVTTAVSHQRTFVLEVMGKYCGYLALVAAIASAAEWVFIPEDPPDDGWEDEMCQKLEANRKQGRRLCIVIVAEGAIDRKGKPITTDDVKNAIKQRTEQDTRVTILGHVQRGGNPSAFDRVLACRMGAEAVAALRDATPDSSACVVSLIGNMAARLPLMACVNRTLKTSEALAAGNYKLALELRGKSFNNNLEIYRKLNHRIPPEAFHISGDDTNQFRIDGKQPQVIAVLNVGAPAAGMNACVRAITRTLLADAFPVLLVNEGFEGLVTDKVFFAKWASVANYISQGASLLGTKRTTPEDNLDKIAEQFSKYSITGLILVGGFEAFMSIKILSAAREKYKEFCIPMVVIPASTINNIPGTELSLGSDTGLNSIVHACDTINQSASGIRKRVFIIETMGGYCGYLATMAALASGADSAYINEEEFGITELKDDVFHLIDKIKGGILRGLVIINEKANKNYNSDFIKRLYSEEGKEHFSSRLNVLGHMQQGGQPSPFDRNYGTKMGVKAAMWITNQIRENCHCDNSIVVVSAHSACLLGMNKRKLEFQPVTWLDAKTNYSKEIPKDQWWMKLRPLLRILAMYKSEYLTQSVCIDDASTD